MEIGIINLEDYNRKKSPLKKLINFDKQTSGLESKTSDKKMSLGEEEKEEEERDYFNMTEAELTYLNIEKNLCFFEQRVIDPQGELFEKVVVEKNPETLVPMNSSIMKETKRNEEEEEIVNVLDFGNIDEYSKRIYK